MKDTIRSFLGALMGTLLFLVILGCSGCIRGKSRPSLPPPASAAIIDGQAGKDRVVVAEAGKIAQEWPDAKPHTDAQIAAVAAAPAADVARLDAAWKAIVKQVTGERDEARKKLAEADAKFHRTVRLWLAFAGFTFGALTIAGGIMFAKFAVLFSWFGRDVLILTASLSSLAWFTSLAYGWAVAHLNWIMGGAAFLLVAVALLIYANIRSDRMDKKAN